MILRDPAPPRLRWPAALGAARPGGLALPFAPTLADDPPAADPVRPAEAAPPADPPPTRPAAPAAPCDGGAAVAPDPVPARPASGPRAVAGNLYSPGEDVERLRDEVELLAAQLPARRAAVRIARNALARAEEQVASAQTRGKKGISSAEEVRTAQFDVEDAKAELRGA